MKHLRRKKNRGLDTTRIVYLDRRHPYDRPRELTIDVRRGEVIASDYAAAAVAIRTSVPLNEIKIIKIVGEEGMSASPPSRR